MDVKKILNDPSISFWLKEAIQNCAGRDPIDVLNDLDILHELTEQRIDDIQGH